MWGTKVLKAFWWWTPRIGSRRKGPMVLAAIFFVTRRDSESSNVTPLTAIFPADVSVSSSPRRNQGAAARTALVGADIDAVVGPSRLKQLHKSNLWPHTAPREVPELQSLETRTNRIGFGSPRWGGCVRSRRALLPVEPPAEERPPSGGLYPFQCVRPPGTTRKTL